MLNENVQNKLHDELDKKIGFKRAVSMDDKANLPYTQAVIQVFLIM